METDPTPSHWHELPHAPAPGTVLGTRDALADGQAMLREVAQFKLLLLRSGQEVKAYANRCAHFGVPLAQRQEHLLYTPGQRITCNVHYARYRWSDGRCETGECNGAPLLAIPLDIDAQGLIRIAHPAPAP